MSRAVTEEEMTQGISRLEAHTAQIMEEAKARGIAVGVVDRTGRILYEKYFGYRDEEKKLPINRDTIFGMASVTKSFTALSIMQMQKDGFCPWMTQYPLIFQNLPIKTRRSRCD